MGPGRRARVILSLPEDLQHVCRLLVMHSEISPETRHRGDAGRPAFCARDCAALGHDPGGGSSPPIARLEYYAEVRVLESAATKDLGLVGETGVVGGVSSGSRGDIYAVFVADSTYMIAAADLAPTGRVFTREDFYPCGNTGAALDDILDPAARAAVTWVSADAGGRSSGPPTAPVYQATCVFVHGADAEVLPGWPTSADQLSILLQKAEVLPGAHGSARSVSWPPTSPGPFLHPGAVLLVMEGPRVVATAVIIGLANGNER